jgi:hypothetical protein
MAESYAQAIKAARERYKEAMDEAAWDALRIVDDYGRQLQTVCKDIADDGWNALRSRAQRLAKAAGQTAAERARAAQRETAKREQRAAKAVLKDPTQAAKVIASLPPQALEEVYHEARLARADVDTSPANRQAAKAAAHEAIAPMKRALSTTKAALGIQALREAREDITDAVESHSMTAHQVQTADRIVNDIANVLMEAKFTEASA